jgi:hypothetical protein
VRPLFKAPRENGSWFRAELDCSQCSSTIQLNKKMKTNNMTILQFRKSIGQSLSWRCGFVLVLLALACFASVQNTQAVNPPPDGGYPGANTAEGTDALFSLTNGIANTAVGLNALHDNTTGGFNVAVGSSALAHNVTGNFNMAIGTDALAQNNANFNLAIGFRVGFMNTTGNHLTGIGAAALRNNTTAGFNTAIGADALRENTISEDNVAVGDGALTSYNGTTVGIDGFNTALGSIALTALTSGFQNVAVGRRAMELMTSGSNNVAVGWRSGDDVTTADNNVFVGTLAGSGTTTGSGNTVVGSNSGGIIGTGTRNIYVGNGVDGIANEIRFIRIGDTSFTDYDCFIAGIKGRAVSSATASLVFVDGNGKLGTVLVDAIGNATTVPMPQGFRVPGAPAEAKDPALSPDVPESKKQGMLNLKVEKLQATVAQQNKQIETLTAQLKEQAAQIQKVSAQLEVGKPAPKVVANK